MRTRLGALGLGVLFALVGCSDSDDDDKGSGSDSAADWNHVEGLDFAEPKEFRSDDGVTEATLDSRSGEVEVSGGRVRGTAYNGAFIGPTLHVAPGESLHVRLTNGLQQHTNVHYHGMHVSPEGNSDNVFLMVKPGEAYDYVLDVPADHDVGTFWYHSHMHMDSESQVFGGLSGVLIVDGIEQLLPEEYRDIPQHLFALKDLQVQNGVIVADNINSDAPTVRTVNGLIEPKLKVRPGETQLWRLANISADIFYNVGFAAQPFVVIAEDGNPVEQTWTAYNLNLPPGKRFDVVIRTPIDSGEYVLETVSYDQGGDQYPRSTLVKVEVAGEKVDELPPLTQGLAPTDNLLAADVAEERYWSFTENDSANTFEINGQQFDPDRVDVRPKLGSVEEWKLRNNTSEQHPFHIHINDFKVLSVNGVPYTSYGQQDTVVLPPHGEVVIRTAFLDFTGKFVFHCHILAHEDGGMMKVVEVVP